VPTADVVQIMLLLAILFFSLLNWLGSLGAAELGQVAVMPCWQSFSPAGSFFLSPSPTSAVSH